MWGFATSAYQIEGGVDLDGRGLSIWDTFCRRPGAVERGENGDVACDHRRRWKADLDLLRALGAGAYRFSVAWPRVMPDGVTTSPAGLDFYRALVDGLLERGIEPWVTLYHWDLPDVLEQQGGWPARDTAYRFAEYARVVGEALGDRPVRWITHNEPWCASVLGYQTGHHAPGRTSFPDALAASHHLLLSHGLAVSALRAAAPRAPVGITLNFLPTVAASPSEVDQRAAAELDGTFNRWFLHPVLGRGYPEDVVALHRRAGRLTGGPADWGVDGRPIVLPGDLDQIAARCDFLGVNYYNRAICRGDEQGNLAPTVHPEPAEQWTDMPWEVHPPSLGALLRRLAADAPGLPLYITENGAAYGDGPDERGQVIDHRRIAYHRGHLVEAARAIEDGVQLQGYFAWSFLDNFEWAFGYAKRFGLVWVDFQTQRRIPKASAQWFAEVIRSNGRSIEP